MSTAVFPSKSGRGRRRDITRAAAGKNIVLRGMQPGKPVVNWGEAPDHVHSTGPNTANYEWFRAHAGAHLVFNAFWKVQHFCVHQMLMSDPMHRIGCNSSSHQGDSAQASRVCRDCIGQGRSRCKKIKTTL
jgi:hypothetical protein